MHLDNNVIHATNEELVGLIKTAQEIIPEMADLDLCSVPSLIVTDIDPNKCRVAAYRLTNCVGAYNSGRTLSGVEARWAWKDNRGAWVCQRVNRDAPPVTIVPEERTAREWIAAAPMASVEAASATPLTPGTLYDAMRAIQTASPWTVAEVNYPAAIENESIESLTVRGRAALTNAAVNARGSVGCVLDFDAGRNVTTHRELVLRQNPSTSVRVAIRNSTGRHWRLFELSASGINERLQPVTRRHAMRFVRNGI